MGTAHISICRRFCGRPRPRPKTKRTWGHGAANGIVNWAGDARRGAFDESVVFF
jgi:hypothetical protein